MKGHGGGGAGRKDFGNNMKSFQTGRDGEEEVGDERKKSNDEVLNGYELIFWVPHSLTHPADSHKSLGCCCCSWQIKM